jgi:diguanylate cyclase (GGDEF)-like protein
VKHMRDSHSISRVTTWISLLITMLIAVIVPVGYFFLSYQHIAGSLTAEARVVADQISREVGRNQQLSQLEPKKLQSLLSRTLPKNYRNAILILDKKGKILVRAAGDDERSPLLQRSSPVIRTGAVMGRVEILSSLRRLVVQTGLVAFAGLFIGLMFLFTLHRVPLRAVYLAEEALRNSRDELEKRVKERTSQLSEANMRLIEEIEARKRAEAKLLHETLHDPLTGLPNRSLIYDRLEHAIAIAKRNDEYFFAILFLDIDRFKFINDTLGHVVGDQLLIAFGHRLSSCIRPGDTLARFGGDEFVVLLEDAGDAKAVEATAGRIQQELHAPFTLSRHEVFTTSSIGLAMGRPTYERPDEILRDADTAMYRAKLKGRDNFVVFEQGMHDHAARRQRLEADLRGAITSNEFAVYYQPIYVLKTNGLVGYEALVRWNHPERGLLKPDEFLPAAEDTGAIVPIDRFVLREACRQLREWQRNFPERPPEFISVNISRKHLCQNDVVECIEQILEETGLDAERLKLEIAEQAITENPEAIAPILERLKALHVQLFIDDFGTGFSSLSSIHRLPIDGLKIDRSFIRLMEDRQDNQKIIRSILALARDMKIDTIAEGLETPDQLERIKSLRCAYGQGYLFSEPVRRDQATALLGMTSTLKTVN